MQTSPPLVYCHPQSEAQWTELRNRALVLFTTAGPARAQEMEISSARLFKQQNTACEKPSGICSPGPQITSAVSDALGLLQS